MTRMSCHCPTDIPPYRHRMDCGYYEAPLNKPKDIMPTVAQPINRSDPVTTPNIPVDVLIEWNATREPQTHIEIKIWNRQKNTVTIFKLDTNEDFTYRERPPVAQELIWLRNIGAIKNEKP